MKCGNEKKGKAEKTLFENLIESISSSITTCIAVYLPFELCQNRIELYMFLYTIQYACMYRMP